MQPIALFQAKTLISNHGLVGGVAVLRRLQLKAISTRMRLKNHALLKIFSHTEDNGQHHLYIYIYSKFPAFVNRSLIVSTHYYFT